ncbi:acyl-CoA ligase (AMP-forming), exosortase A system-associated [Novosphingobium sp. MBES04]|uniref:acyl-CoA ligase (AMP-forming), exosortase A system-associated n=1 Tax=Novosphingobium sp. MBES04 TaxID=1206458 RepID=UPI000694BD51|nr:acyl-CoA ligase (AMP-forming), exosortase A system-associated [Novosphingobium sp. MBES04]
MRSTLSPPLPVPARPVDHVIEMGEASAQALVLRETVLDYKTLRLRVGRLAAWLAREVPEPGARVATWAAKGELACLMPLAAARAGLVHVPVNPLLKHAQVAHILADSGAALLLGTPSRLASLQEGDVPEGCRCIEEANALAQAAQMEEPLPPSAADTADLAAILYTSGSTGRPKGVMLSHANLWLGAESVAQYTQLSAQDRTLAVLPLAFDYGQNQLFSTWLAGGCVVPLDYLLPRDLVKAVERHRITTLAAVPPLWVQVCELDWPAETAAHLRRLTNSGGALTPDLVARLRALFPEARLYAMYGLTEAFRSTYLDPALIEERPTSMGKAVPHAEILVINDAGEIAADDEEGELVHCGPLVGQGYWQDPARTAERYRPAPSASHTGGIAVWSGDRVRRDAQGFLYFVGRRDAMIKSAGNRISPQEVEDAALASGLVAEAVALGVPDARLGQAVHLVVRAAIDEPEAQARLPRALMKELPNFMQPKAIHWRSALPTGPNGKIDRAGLAAEIRASLIGEVPA